MHLACAACGLDPNTGSFVVQVAQAAVIAVPFVFRQQLLGAVRGVIDRRRGPADTDACPIDTGSPASGVPPEAARAGEPPGSVEGN